MTESTPFFSIVMPVTRPELMMDALATVYGQDFPSYEVLIHNNTGADITLPAPYAGDARFKLFNHSGQVNIWENWERSFVGCSGQYVTMVPDDDGLISDSLSVLHKVLVENPVDYLRWGITAYLERADDPVRTVRVPKHTGALTEIETGALLDCMMRSLRVTRFKKFIPHIAMGCVSRSMLERIQSKSPLCYVSGVPMESVTPDWCIAAKVLYEKPTALHIDFPVYLFRGHDDSTATKGMSKNKTDSLDDPWLPHLGIKNTVLNRVFVCETLLAVQKEVTGKVVFDREGFLAELLDGASTPKDLLRAIEYAIGHGISLDFANHSNGSFHLGLGGSGAGAQESAASGLKAAVASVLHTFISKVPALRSTASLMTTESLSEVAARVKPANRNPVKTGGKFDRRLFEALASKRCGEQPDR